MTETVSGVLISWLRGYPGVPSGAEITTDQLTEELDRLGLFRAPGDEVEYNIDGSRDITGYYILRFCALGIDQESRAEADLWLEGLSRWVRDQNVKRSLPTFTDDREAISVTVSEGAYLLSQDSRASVYQVGISVTYYEPKEEQQEEI